MVEKAFLWYVIFTGLWFILVLLWLMLRKLWWIGIGSYIKTISSANPKVLSLIKRSIGINFLFSGGMGLIFAMLAMYKSEILGFVDGVIMVAVVCVFISLGLKLIASSVSNNEV